MITLKGLLMDRERILGKLRALDTYLAELQEILPQSFEEFQKIEKKRACERLLQISIEAVIDICSSPTRFAIGFAG